MTYIITQKNTYNTYGEPLFTINRKLGMLETAQVFQIKDVTKDELIACLFNWSHGSEIKVLFKNHYTADMFKTKTKNNDKK